MSYEIIRYHQGAPSEIIHTGLSLTDAQAHCQQEDTRGPGWFDGYRAAPDYDFYGGRRIRTVGLLEAGVMEYVRIRR